MGDMGDMNRDRDVPYRPPSLPHIAGTDIVLFC